MMKKVVDNKHVVLAAGIILGTSLLVLIVVIFGTGIFDNVAGPERSDEPWYLGGLTYLLYAIYIFPFVIYGRLNKRNR